MHPASPEILEGRIIAQRRVLAEILARLAQADPSLIEALEDRTVVRDHQEDPGVVDASPEFATQAAAADEVRLILEAARGRLAEGRG